MKSGYSGSLSTGIPARFAHMVLNPNKSAGIEQVWIFAHPDNKRVTGPLQKFATLFDAPAYAPLLGHLNYVINDKRFEGGVARFVLTVLALSLIHI